MPLLALAQGLLGLQPVGQVARRASNAQRASVLPRDQGVPVLDYAGFSTAGHQAQEPLVGALPPDALEVVREPGPILLGHQVPHVQLKHLLLGKSAQLPKCMVRLNEPSLHVVDVEQVGHVLEQVPVPLLAGP